MLRGAGLLSGSGMLSISSSTPRTLSSEILRDRRGSSPEILNLTHTHFIHIIHLTSYLTNTITQWLTVHHTNPHHHLSLLLGHAGICDHHGSAEHHLDVDRLQDVEGRLPQLTGFLPVPI